ncbi:M56 family metallopeptidase [Macrococcoides canis]|uniref:M56 family metallopeptidase n=1 Tax=Macrococcoides canis TaxID=1855823 RepID=UPI0020B6A52E|nr:M56 family metallopeptidase [Macrococcus canis]UTH07136.1 M48 family metalloprotease [Macrococcus canis]
MNYILISILLSGISFLLIKLYKFILNQLKIIDFSIFPWLIILISMFIPLINYNFSFFNNNSIDKTNSNTVASNELYTSYNHVKDLAISLSSTSDNWDVILNTIWIVGIFLFTCYYLFIVYKLINTIKYSKRSTQIIKNMSYEILISSHISVPFTIWLGKHYIVIPDDVLTKMTNEEIKMIITHEITHIKRNDIFKCYFFNIFKIIFWYNPFIHFSAKNFINDIETACDREVLHNATKSERKLYGLTLLKIGSKTKNDYALLTFSKPAKVLTKRIKLISNDTFKSIPIKIRILFLLVIISLITSIKSLFAYNDTISYYPEKKLNEMNYHTVDLKVHFKDFNGTFVMYNLKNDSMYIYNKELALERTSPDSTYKIIDSIIHLNNKTISTTNNTKKWDGVDTSINEWNKDHSLKTALQDSVNWYFESVDKNISKKKLLSYLNEVNYGNQDISGQNRPYWLESSLKISPIEQAMIMKNLQQNHGIFSKKYTNYIIKSLSNNDNKSWGKTGTAIINNHEIKGWYVGGFEKNNQQYVFATLVKKNNDANGKTAKIITEDIISSGKIK